MVDKVKALKIEDATDGTQMNFAPTETDPSEDYLAAKGLALENDDNTRVEKVTNEVAFADIVNGTKKVSDLLDAEQEDFDPQTSGLVSVKTGPAIRELANNVATSASPGFSWGKSGNVTPNTWLLNDGVPSNKAGRTNFLTSAVITKVFIGNEKNATFTIEFFTHDGDEINLTSIGTVTNTATRSSTHTVSFAVPLNKQIAVQVDTGAPKNIVVGALISGTL